MYLKIKDDLFNKLIKISNIKREYVGDVAVKLLENAISETNLKALQEEYGRGVNVCGGGDKDENK